MILTASLCDAPHINEFELGKQHDCICRMVAPDYSADLSIPILNHGRNAKEREIGSSSMYSVQVDLIIIITFF